MTEAVGGVTLGEAFATRNSVQPPHLEAAMPLRLIALDPGTDGAHCPAFFVADSGNLVVQGPRVTDPGVLADAARLGMTGPDEAVIEIPARMKSVILRALLEEADGADPGADGVR
ncbi:hypothetical protein [Actinomadura kijaniata]|uniref:hypothetical protein n=1 Tax=Actinomadura kijaniata TaxID=46161 RepID=UPI0009FD9A13|nr:hypothetical protein [Actinomadura kijaniata]